MPEGDTVWRTAQRLDAALAGKPIVEADLRWPDISTADLSGRATIEVVSRGKHLLHRIEGGLTLHSHLRMEGQWRVEATPSVAARWRRNPQLRALVAAADWTALGLRLGMLDLVPTAREGDLVGHLGPDVLGPDWDAARAVDNLARAHVPIGQALLDQRNLAGVGTMWCAETLFLEKVPPWSLADGVDRSVVERVVSRAHRLIDNGRAMRCSRAPGPIVSTTPTTCMPGAGGRVAAAAPRCAWPRSACRPRSGRCSTAPAARGSRSQRRRPGAAAARRRGSIGVRPARRPLSSARPVRSVRPIRPNADRCRRRVLTWVRDRQTAGPPRDPIQGVRHGLSTQPLPQLQRQGP